MIVVFHGGVDMRRSLKETHDLIEKMAWRFNGSPAAVLQGYGG